MELPLTKENNTDKGFFNCKTLLSLLYRLSKGGDLLRCNDSSLFVVRMSNSSLAAMSFSARAQ